MKIVGNAPSDYYDSCAMYGVDETRVFVRNSEFTEVQVHSNLQANLLKGNNEYAVNYRRSEPKHTDLIDIDITDERYSVGGPSALYVSWEAAMICGELQLVYSFKPAPNFFRPGMPDIPRAFGLKAAVEWIKKHTNVTDAGANDRAIKSYIHGSIWRASRSAMAMSDASEFEATRVALSKVAEELGVSHFIVNGVRRERGKLTLTIATYPNLKELGVPSTYDPFEMHTKIEAYLFDELQVNSKLPIVISDKSKIAKRGFDEKYGFRTRPK